MNRDLRHILQRPRRFDTPAREFIMSAMMIGYILLAACSTTIVTAQTSWWRVYGGKRNGEGHSVQQTTDGGYIVAGYLGTPYARNADAYLLRTNGAGDVLWAKCYGGPYDDMGHSVQQTTDGGFVIAGRTRSFGAGAPNDDNIYLVRTDAQGDTLWTRAYGGVGPEDEGCVRQTADGGFILAGTTLSLGPRAYYNYSIFVVKTDARGDTLWTRTYVGVGNYYGRSIQPTTDGGYIVAGNCATEEPNSQDVCLVRISPDGEALWTKTYGGTASDECSSVQQTADGGYVIAGRTRSFGVDEGDVYVIRTNALGGTLWTRTYGGRYDDRGYSVQLTAGGGFVVTGYTFSFGAGTPRHSNVYLIGIDAAGDMRWTRAYGGAGYEEGRSVQQTTDGDYIITGVTTHEGADSDISLIKTGLLHQSRVR